MILMQVVPGPRRLDQPIEGAGTRESTDLQLLQRFRADRDEAAFADLVRRHGGTVWGVCRRVLHQEQDAEDAFQAVFLVLARKAASIRKGEAVGSWLYGVAYRVAMKARQSAARRHDVEQRATGPTPEPPPWGEAACRELQRLLDEEVQRLAAKYRAPFVLCCLEGLSKAEAAQELGWKEGTVSGRLAQARKLLQTRLARRGVALSAALTVLALAQNTAAAAPPILVHATVIAALAGKAAAAASPTAFALAEGLVHSMAVAKLKAAILLLLGLTTLAAGTGLAAVHLGAAPAEKAAPEQPPVVVGDIETFVPPPVPLLRPIDEQVLALAFSPDGKRLVTAGARHTLPGQLKIWDVATARELASVPVAQGIRAVAFSPDGRTLATGHFGGAIRLRDPATGEERALLMGHTIGVNGLAYSADGTLLASAGLDRAVKVWDVKGLRERQVLHGHTDMIFSVAFFRHGRALVTGGQDKVARIWDLATGKEKFLLQGHASGIEMVAIAPDDKLVATGSWDQTIKLWDAETGKETGALKANYGSVLAIAFSPSGDLLASAAGDGTVRLWDVKSRKEVGKLEQHDSSIWTLHFSSDGKLLASGSSDRTAKLWDVAARQEVATLVTSELRPVRALAYAPDGKAFGIATDDRKVQIRDARTAELVTTLQGHDGAVTCLAFAPDGRTLASGSVDKTLKLWDRATGKELQTLRGHTGGVHALIFSPDGTRLASTSFDQSVKLWDPATGKETATFKGHEAAVLAVAFAPDGRSLASGSSDGVIMLWDLAGGTEARTLRAQAWAVRALAYSPRPLGENGEGVLASAGDDGIVRLWDLAEGKERRAFRGHAGGVLALAFSPSGRSLVSAGRDRTAIVWDPVTGESRQVLHGHKEAVTALAIHPQGQELVSGGRDATVLRWREAKARMPVMAPAKGLNPTGGQKAKPTPVADKPSSPKLRTNYPQEFFHSFQGNPALPPAFAFLGKDADQWVKFDPSGLRIRLPKGFPTTRGNTGVAITVPVRGDFEITITYEIVSEPEPGHEGQGTGFGLNVELDTPETNRVFFNRVVRWGKQLFATFVAWSPAGADKPETRFHSFATKVTTGRLCLVRAGADLFYFVAEGAKNDFTFLRQDKFSSADVRQVAVSGTIGGPDAALDVRVLDLRIRADSLGEVPATNAEAGRPQGAGKGWWAAGAIIGVLLALGLVGGLFSLRRSRRATKSPETAGGIETPAASATAPILSLTCAGCEKRLKVKADWAGKKVKCPRCGQSTQVPKGDPRVDSPTVEKRFFPVRNKKWLGALLLLMVSAFAGVGIVWWRHLPQRSPLVDVPLGSEFAVQVEESGFLGDLHDGKGRPFRWTNGKAKMVISIDPKHPPEALRVFLNPFRPPQASQTVPLHLTVNRHDLFNEKVAAEPWERTFALRDIDLGDKVVLEIASDTFVPNGSGDGTALGVQVRGVVLLARVADLADLFLGSKFIEGVKETGFYGQEYESDGQPYRWTNGNARLTIPVTRGKAPRAVHVRLFPWRPARANPAALRIVVNGQPLFNEKVPPQPWEKTLDLSGIDLGQELVLEIVSDTFIPREFDGGGDSKARGVEVKGIKLLERFEAAQR